MASSSLLQSPIDLSPEPDLHPLYPTTSHIAELLSSNSGLTPDQRAELVSHCMARACVFAELGVMQYLLSDQQAQTYVDLSVRDEDGVGLVSLAIHGFGSESDRDVEREECVRLLIAQGADLAADKAGWTPLHHAALLSPPTLISHLMTHGCSPFAVTRRNLTPLDIVTAHSILPGRDDVALLLEEAMRGEGWTGGKMAARRRLFEERRRRKEKRRVIRDTIGKTLGVHPKWWGDSDFSSSSDSESGDEEVDENVYTPPPDYSSMLVFSPPSLPQIFESLITNFQPSFRDSQPANTLYMLARFACLTCDHTWLEDLIIGATDAIEETFFERADDVTCLVFWLRNTTLWLHLLRCDNSINEACEMLGSFELIEEVINSVFVFIIRFAERRIDQLLDAALLEYIPLASEFDSVQFESEWSFLRPFAGKKKAPPATVPPPVRTGLPPPSPSPSPGRPSSPSGSISASTSRGFSSLKQSFSRARAASSATPVQSIFSDAPPPPSPADVTSFLTALHTLLTLSDVNPVLTTQLWSQVMYWTSCEIFNRILTRKKYLCRSRAVQIGMNLSALEEWVVQMGLPRGVQSHFNPVRDLVNWLQCLSSITEFSNLVATIQTMNHINPLQMRRAVREYKYEVNEGRMTDECVQYLTQLQKDWERHRVKLGVEALRKEITQRDTDHDSVSSYVTESPSISGPGQTTPSIASSEGSAAQHGIDMLFERAQEKSSWEPAKPPQVLGELLDSRHMLPLTFPSDPRMLSALPGKLIFPDDKHANAHSMPDSRSSSRASEGNRGAMPWRSRDRTLRQVGIGTLQWVDGVRSAARWGRLVNPDEEEMRSYSPDPAEGQDLTVDTHITPLTRKPSGRKGRPSQGGEVEETTPVERP
ncbi:DIL domain-containing protein [Mycena rosella]|uniref:DIL domain-containing protein n=1 Tax=Mycena rosella TaxID=1033263 RepID=A0AAD7GVX5_MYCRO|nr:DIL domain-containing protein [Mycena rosella]